jgi:hypothetical protein
MTTRRFVTNRRATWIQVKGLASAAYSERQGGEDCQVTKDAERVNVHESLLMKKPVKQMTFALPWFLIVI